MTEIVFYVNREQQPRRVAAAADLTVLQYLRGDALCGSKEGCASGDCGACTAVLAQADGDGLCYAPINTCITFLSALHGNLLVTVEGLADGDDAPHAVQAAMVETHGSQCGFCTPGFVMSLFAMCKHPPADASAENVVEAIAGNLCRCTGYRPIISAGRALLETPPAADYYDVNAAEIAARLRALPAIEKDAAAGAADTTDTPANPVHLAADVETLAALKRRHPDARLFAGSTDLALEVTIGDNTLPPTIDVSRIAHLHRQQESDTHWTLGAAVTIADCITFFATRLPQLLPYLKRFGSTPVRARATIGGNIGNASPIADMPPALIALGAEVVLAKDGATRTLPLEEFYLDYKKTRLAGDEWIDAVRIPRPPDGAVFKVFKISKRIEDDISAVAAACCWQVGDDGIVQTARLAFGGMAATPKRAVNAEAAYLGSPWSAETTAAAADALARDFAPISDMRASSGYRLRVAAALLQRAYLETQEALPRIEEIANVD